MRLFKRDGSRYYWYEFILADAGIRNRAALQIRLRLSGLGKFAGRSLRKDAPELFGKK